MLTSVEKIFIRFIKNNLEGISNKPQIGQYEDNVFAMKHDTLNVMKSRELIR